MRKMIFCAVLSFFLVNCSTVQHGPLQRISVSSKPQGASVRLGECGFGGTDSAKTPAIVFVNRRATHCTLTFTHPAHGTRTVSLLRTQHPDPGLSEKVFKGGGSIIDGIYDPEAAWIALGVGGSAMAIGGTFLGIDAISGANYRQNRSIVLVDFNKPIPDVAGRYLLESLSGKELPTETWTTRNGTCQVYTNSASLDLEDNGRWTSVITDQESCGYNALIEFTDQGVYSVDADRVLLESEDGVTVGTLQNDQIELTIRRPVSPEGRTATYRRQRRQ